MTTTTELRPLLKRLKLGAMLDTLPERLTLARRDQLDYAAFLQILLADEVSRRDNRNLEIHLQVGGIRRGMPAGGFRLDHRHNRGPAPAGCRLLPGLP